ncbi:E3 ubiquitin-protein ligase At4g11680 isoform X1 [Nicotiana tabacum]|uniref:RING-type E3 ubiquitin transferase n=1 Tax=Nicotiana tabacum TaxID=4097 RepID=A0A1S4C4L6_TOBAC|nr:PREDICTED: E3 ubiquitin-protein ligase At4g11680-like isoform X1 [Nicotiana tabacum]
MDQEFQRNIISENGGFEHSYFRGLGTPFSLYFSRMASFLNLQNHYQSFDDDGVVSYDDDYASPFSYYGYSRPIVVLDVIWNLAFVCVSCFVLLTTISERPSTPLRLWIGGYALQCLLHVGFIWIEFQRRSFDDFDAVNFDGASSFSLFQSSIMKRLESVNTVISSIWWVFGFYWIVMGGQPLLQDSPRLYWLSVVFLAFDVFFMVFCIVMAFVLFFAFFCFFPFIATVAYAMRLGDGASENDIKTLPKYRYGQSNTTGNLVNVKTGEDHLNVNVKTGEDHFASQFNSSDSVPELALQPDDSECCICLYKYLDGVELCVLPCNHHFHHGCISKWLRINATCPLCKFNILRGETLV